jgi:hypothetical protein
MAAFLVMMTSPMHGYQQLGALGAVGVVFSAAFALGDPALAGAGGQNRPGNRRCWLTKCLGKVFPLGSAPARLAGAAG